MSLRKIIADSFLSNSDNPALLNLDGKQYNYYQLKELIEERSSAIAAASKGSLIGLYSEKNIDAAVFVYSVLYAGKAYLPIDYRSPIERIIRILKTAEPTAVIVQEKFLKIFSEAVHQEAVQFTTQRVNEDYALVIFANAKTYSEDLAYILFTSGSTGVPKGIMHTNQSATAFLHWCKETFGTQNKRFLSVAPFQFDLSVFDLFFPLMSGGSLLLPTDFALGNSRMMSELLEDYEIEIVYSTPSFFNWLLTTGRPERRNFTEVKQLLIAGEVLHWNLLHELKKFFVNTSFYNLYGPTETNVCTFYKVNFDDEQHYNVSVPIGKPCSNCQMYLQLGTEGNELLISGENVMNGYVAIEKSPFVVHEGKNFYNTGDVVEQVFDSNLAYLSRADRMIKKNGFRIEPGEVETAVKKLDGIKDAVAVAKKNDESTLLLVFLVSEKEYDMLTLRNYCAEKIPYYMIPDSFIFVENIPLNSNHKTDTAKLLKLVP